MEQPWPLLVDGAAAAATAASAAVVVAAKAYRSYFL